MYQAIERRKFPVRRDDSETGVTTEEYSACWRRRVCLLNDANDKCYEDQAGTRKIKWEKEDGIVVDTKKSCPETSPIPTTDVEVAIGE